MKRYVLLFLFPILCGSDLSPAVVVFDKHPRLLFRDEPWGERSVTTDLLRRRARDDRYSKYLEKMARRGSLNHALLALMLDDKEAALKCISMLEKPFDFDGTTDDGRVVMWDAWPLTGFITMSISLLIQRKR